jgi:cyclic pyranopterin phosphate synthase
VLAGIDAALAAGLGPVKINCVLMRGTNDDELEAFAALTRTRAVHVRFIEVMPVHENVDAAGQAWISSDEVLDRLRELGACIRSRTRTATGRHACSPTRARPARSA